MKIIGGFYIAFLLLCIGIGIGWVMNIVSLVHTSFSPITGIAVARLVGIFIPPLGGILVYM